MTVPLPQAAGAPAFPISRLSWPRTLALHLAPAAVTFAGALALVDPITAMGLPANAALTAAFALLLIPIEVAVLLAAARTATGSYSISAVTSLFVYRNPLRRSALVIVPALFVTAVAVAAQLTPVAGAVAQFVEPVYPSWQQPDHDPTADIDRAIVLAFLAVSLIIDGIAIPVVEECYFRGYLLRRIPSPSPAQSRSPQFCSPRSTTGSPQLAAHPRPATRPHHARRPALEPAPRHPDACAHEHLRHPARARHRAGVRLAGGIRSCRAR